ncbi:tRNA pseudouridine(13) synthase TruD [Desulfoferula mesophila]|uniref:tRNA pseudouridine synthase D n=1 Tax=Desulfoferula mesophila TaxID=3058419 RepID=A0AAU9F0H7_9BACT|nr:tRNA pseudouridine synthase D [Desulfoferula mesophilus]
MSPLPSEMGPPPFITPELPGVGGELKAEPAHFVVEEIPLYLPEGVGPHLHLRISREGMTTRALADRLAWLFDLPPRDVGFAGLKDKQARAVQSFSLPLESPAPQEAARKVAQELEVEVLDAARHQNKLRTGHLLGNRFTILLTGVGEGALATAQAVAAAVAERGLPNFYGSQRFGREGDNALQGRRALGGRGPRDKWLRKLLLNAWQSALFNAWLARRIERGDFARLVGGDLAKKTDTGGMFTTDDAALEQPRLDAGQITYTGPMFGKKMRWPNEPAAAYEREILEEEEVDQATLKKSGLMGSRRVARLSVEGLSIAESPEGLVFGFSLPKGSYATVLMREFMKSEAELPESD